MKETKELIIGLMALSALLAKHFKDGVQLGKDLPAIWAELAANPELKEKLEAAYKDAGLIKTEWQNVSVAGMAEIVSALVPETVKLIEAIKPVEAAPAPSEPVA